MSSPCARRASRQRSGMLLVDVDDDFLDGLEPLPVFLGRTRRADAIRSARSPRAASSRSGCRAAIRRGPRPRRRPCLRVSVIRSATLPSASRSRRSRMTRLCTLSPSWPASGPSLMRKVMVSVGGSIGCAGSASRHLGIAERVGDGRLGQPGDGDDVARLRRPRSGGAQGRGSRAPWRRGHGRSSCHRGDNAFTAMSGFTDAERMRPVRMRPRNGSASIVVASMRNGPPSTLGGATCFSTLSSSGAMSSFGPFGSTRHPALLGGAVEDREIELLVGGVERGEEVEDLVEHFDMRSSGRSILLIDDDGLKPDRQRLRRPRTSSAASALRPRRRARSRRRPY